MLGNRGIALIRRKEETEDKHYFIEPLEALKK